MRKCEIQWIDAQGRTTPDDHPMTGLAVPWGKDCNCYGMKGKPCVKGVVQCEHALEQSMGHHPFAVCKDHEERMREYLNWELIPVGGCWRV